MVKLLKIAIKNTLPTIFNNLRLRVASNIVTELMSVNENSIIIKPNTSIELKTQLFSSIKSY